MQSELDCHNYNDILEFEQQLNSLYFENIQVLKSFSKLKNNQVNEAKKFLLDHTLQDIMNDYQRLTIGEAKKFDTKYGELINQASRAMFSTYGDENY